MFAALMLARASGVAHRNIDRRPDIHPPACDVPNGIDTLQLHAGIVA